MNLIKHTGMFIGEVDFMIRGFGASVVMRITGVSRMRLEHWDRTGIISPSIRSGSGKGSRKAYSFQDMVALRVALGFRNEGIALPKIRATVEYLKQNFPDLKSPLSELRLVTNGADIFAITDNNEILLDCLKGQLVFSFSIGSIIDELRGAVLKLETPLERQFSACGGNYTAILENDLQEGGYTVTCKEIPQAISQGETEAEALENITDAVELCMEHFESSGRLAGVM